MHNKSSPSHRNGVIPIHPGFPARSVRLRMNSTIAALLKLRSGPQPICL